MNFALIAIILFLLASQKSTGGGGINPEPPLSGKPCTDSDRRRMMGYIEYLRSQGYSYATLPWWLKIPFNNDYMGCRGFNDW